MFRFVTYLAAGIALALAGSPSVDGQQRPAYPPAPKKPVTDVYHGIRVTDPKEIQPAVARAMKENAAGRLAVIDVVLSDYLPRG